MQELIANSSTKSIFEEEIDQLDFQSFANVSKEKLDIDICSYFVQENKYFHGQQYADKISYLQESGWNVYECLKDVKISNLGYAKVCEAITITSYCRQMAMMGEVSTFYFCVNHLSYAPFFQDLKNYDMVDIKLFMFPSKSNPKLMSIVDEIVDVRKYIDEMEVGYGSD